MANTVMSAEMLTSAVIDLSQVPACLLRVLVQKKPLQPDALEAVLRSATHKLSETLQAQAVALFVVGRTSNRIQIHHVCFSPFAYGKDEAKKELFQEKSVQLEKMILPRSQTTAGHVITKGQSLVVADAAAVTEFYDPIGWAPEFVIRSILAVPLRLGDTVIGCLEALNKCPDGVRPVPFTPEDLRALLSAGPYFARAFLRAGDVKATLSEHELARCQAQLAGCEFVELQTFNADLALLTLIGPEKVNRYNILPLAKLTDHSIKAAISNPLDYQRIADFELVTGFKLSEKVVATATDIASALKRLFPESSRVTDIADSLNRDFAGSTGDAAVLEDFEADDEQSAPIVKLATRIIEDAHAQGASDIHVEPFQNKLLVRYRIDGVCRVKLTLPIQAHRALVSRLKIMSELDIAEHRLPQDGRIIFRKFSTAHDIDLRVSIAPMAYGESVVMRILDKSKSTLPLEKLGFCEHNMRTYRKVIQAPYGMILHAGPTGSGKSMTLFAALNAINSPEWKIVTAEDPIEYTLEGISQMQMKEDIGLTFASALRCFLRQDPDIILVGEIRDRETAEIAIEAALTGHLIFSTLHTNDASSAITRLTDLRVEPFLISTTLICICAQRLFRRLCSCKEARPPSPEELALVQRAKDGATIGNICFPRGCDACDHIGYKGRIGIHELLLADDPMRELIAKGAPALQLKQAARSNGMRTLFEDAMEKVKAGISSMPEALATAHQDD
jgi:type IV pilus assembly protein PilB